MTPARHQGAGVILSQETLLDLNFFDVHGPYTIPLVKRTAGRYVEANPMGFWSKLPALRDRKGVYLFCMRAGRGYTPIYVGKAVRQSFENEVFESHKRADKYNPALADYERGTPVLFLLVEENAKKRTNGKQIDKLETFLIEVASVKNPDLSNVHKKPEYNWGISGVLRENRRGAGTRAAGLLKKAVDLS